MRRLVRLALLTVVLGVLTLANASAAVAPDPYAGVIVVERPHAQLYPRTDGVNVVWSDAWDEVQAHWDVVGADVAHGWVFPVAIGGNTKGGIDIDGRWIVWTEENGTYQGGKDDNSDVRAFDLTTNTELTIANSPQSEGGARVSGDWVIYMASAPDLNPEGVLMARNLATMEPAIELATVTGYQPISPVIDNGRVVWADQAPQTVGSSRLWTMRLGVDTAPVLVREEADIGGNDLDVGGDIVVHLEYDDLVAHNLVTGERLVIAKSDLYDDYDGPEYQHPTTDGRFACWTDNENWDEGGNQIQCYDLLTESRFVAYDGGYNWWAHVENGVIVWTHWDTVTDDQASEANVFITQIEHLTPYARRSPPATTNPLRTFVPETGHYLNGPIRDYWNNNGALPVFGYPLTEDFMERDADLDEFFVVQYFERERFEWHAENAGTPYEVLLGRLGAELLERQGRDWQFFPKADPRADHYMPETGHAIAPEFWEFWSGHGLDFGDEGTSFRESLALFGYPLSEPMIETNADDDTVLTQYFERAVFEFHPDNPANYRVLLRRLGAEEMAARGW